MHPYLGYTADWSKTFLYRVISVNSREMRISIPNPPALPVGGRLHLCLPYPVDTEYLDSIEILEAQNYNVFGRLCHRTPLRYQLCFGGDMENYDPAKLLKDAYLSKRAICIYFTHLIPFFSKLSNMGEHAYSRAEQRPRAILAEMKRKCKDLKQMLGYAQAGELDRISDIDYLECCLSEIDMDDIQAIYSSFSVPQYLKSIRLTEHKLALNYNTYLLLKTSV